MTALQYVIAVGSVLGASLVVALLVVTLCAASCPVPTSRPRRTTMSEELTEVDIRLHALNLAVAQRREVFRVNKPDPDELADPGWLARETLHDARLYAEWLANGDESIETPEQSAAIVDANLERMGLTLGGES